MGYSTQKESPGIEEEAVKEVEVGADPLQIDYILDGHDGRLERVTRPCHDLSTTLASQLQLAGRLYAAKS